MKLVTLTFLMLFSLPTWAGEFKLTPMIGLGYRLDTSNSNYENNTYNNNQRNDKFVLTAKVFTFSIPSSQSEVLLGGFGYAYQPPQEHDISFSPIAYKDPRGLTMSLDLYRPHEYRGGWLGFSIGWSF